MSVLVRIYLYKAMQSGGEMSRAVQGQWGAGGCWPGRESPEHPEPRSFHLLSTAWHRVRTLTRRFSDNNSETSATAGS